jgi:hypothetical protein
MTIWSIVFRSVVIPALAYDQRKPNWIDVKLPYDIIFPKATLSIGISIFDGCCEPYFIMYPALNGPLRYMKITRGTASCSIQEILGLCVEYIETGKEVFQKSQEVEMETPF